MAQTDQDQTPESLASALQIIEARIAELEPLADELRKLKAARQALATGDAAPARRRGPGRPRKDAAAAAA